MSNTIGELIIKAALPKGSAWKPKKDGNYDKILKTTGKIIDLILDKNDKIRKVRSPLETDVLDDLEREYGILTNILLTEAERRIFLDDKKKNLIIDGNPEGLEDILQKVDPGLFVYQNDPPVDPNPFLSEGFIIINNGRGDQTSGIPIPEENFSSVFFVGGVAVRNGMNEIISIDEVVLPIEKEEFVTDPIVAYKGLQVWCVAKLLVGVKKNLCDGAGNSITDAVGDNIYAVGSS